ncbi:MAG: hypothetical protein WC378_03805 [Opitutaceae bacterium]|jgi:hypothetical protein
MINTTSKTDSMLRPEAIAGQVPRPAAPAPRPADTDRLSASSQETLAAALSQQPEVRPEVVARGRELAADATYPPLQIILQLSELLINSKDLAE